MKTPRGLLQSMPRCSVSLLFTEQALSKKNLSEYSVATKGVLKSVYSNFIPRLLYEDVGLARGRLCSCDIEDDMATLEVGRSRSTSDEA